MHQTCTNTKKQLNFPETMGPFLSSCWIFFFFFGACRCLVHLVVCFFCFWCLSMFCEVKITKPAQAPKKQKKINFPGTMGPLLSSCWIFCFLCFFWCLPMFGASSVFFFFFGCLSMFCEVRVTKPAQAPKKNKTKKPLDAPNLHKHKKNKKTKISRNYGSTFE